jgi:nitrate reductase gamma subunit
MGQGKLFWLARAGGHPAIQSVFMENKQLSTFQLVWGLLLLLAGIGVFFRIPQIMPEIKKIEHFAPYMFFIYFCFYLIGVLLIVGGGRKVYTYLKQASRRNSSTGEDGNNSS